MAGMDDAFAQLLNLHQQDTPGEEEQQEVDGLTLGDINRLITSKWIEGRADNPHERMEDRKIPTSTMMGYSMMVLKTAMEDIDMEQLRQAPPQLRQMLVIQAIIEQGMTAILASFELGMAAQSEIDRRGLDPKRNGGEPHDAEPEEES